MTESKPPESAVRVRAATVRVRDQFVMARYGRLARERYRAAASARLSHVILTPGDGWVDFASFIEATELVCRLFADGDENLAKEIGRFGAEANMGTWRTFVYRLLSPRRVFELAGTFWRHHYDGGKLTTELVGTDGLRIGLEGFPTQHRLHCLSVLGWCERTVELGKPKQVSFIEDECRVRGDARCSFLGRWG